MPLSVLCSLGLMLQLIGLFLHIVAISTPGWVQFGAYVPVTLPFVNQNITRNATDSESHAVPYNGPRKYVQLRLGLWDWCQQFDQVTTHCQEPGFLPTVGGLAVIAVFTLLVAVSLLLSTNCLDPNNRKCRPVTIVSLVFSLISVAILLALAALYAIGTSEEVDKILRAASVTSHIHYLGWAFGTEVVSVLLTGLAALFICIDLRHRPKTPTDFTPVTIEV